MNRKFMTLLISVSLLGTVGCGMNKIQERSYQDNKTFDYRGPIQIQDLRPTIKTDPVAMENRLNTIPGIQRSSVVIYGDSIFIGFRKDPSYRGSENALKRKVIRSVMADVHYNQLYVVTNPKLVSRIENLSQRIHTGQQVTQVELQKLMNDVGLKIEPINYIEKT